MNSVVLVGRITANPEVRKTQSGLSVCSFTLAVIGRKKEDVDFINCVAWRQLADFLGQYAKKGDLIGVDGRITSRTYERDGQKVYVVEVVADEVKILAHKQNQQNEAQSAPVQNRAQTVQNKPSVGYQFTAQEIEMMNNGIDPDDLPF